jgi:hypothetical protein
MAGFWRWQLKRLFSFKLLSSCFLLSLLVVPTAFAQNIEITAPENKEVTPGEFVTLVFRLTSLQTTRVEVSATSALNWQILRQPGTIELNTNEPKPVAITIGVPNDAAAAAVETVTLTIGDDPPITVTLTVKAQRVLELQTPSDVILGKENLRVLLTNKGNVPDEVTLELLSTGVLEDQRTLTLEPLSEQEQIFELEREGLYIVKLSNKTGSELTKAVNVIRFGVPEPEPFALVGDASASLDTDLGWGTSLALGGSLSDDFVVDSYLEAPRWQRSFASLDSQGWGVRIGFAKAPRPFFSNFPQPFGVSGRYSQETASLIGTFGWLGNSQWSGYVAPTLNVDEQTQVGVGAGLSAGQPIASATYRFKYDKGQTDVALSYLSGGFNAEGQIEVTDIPGKLVGNTAFRGVGRRDASFGVQADYSLESFISYAGLTLALGPDASSDYTLGLSTDLQADVPGQLGVGFQLSSLSSFAALRYGTPLGNGWQTNNQAGVLFDKDGFGVTLDTHWSVLQQNYLSLDGQFIFRRSQPLDGRLGARLEVPFDVVRAYGELEWGLSEQNIGVNAGALWQTETYGLEVLGNLNYNYSGEVTPFSAELALRGTYKFTLDVPEPITESFGGRNLGRLIGSIKAGDIPVANVQLELDRYTLITDENGTFTADLPPGDYEVKLQAATLPVTFRLVSENKATIIIERGRETPLVFEAAATAAVSGRVLEDANSDGLADENAKGVPAQLVLTDSEGLRRSIFTDAEGSFLVKGLLPGTARIKVLNLPLGSKLVGSDTLELPLEAGKVSEVTFVANPPTTVSQTFTKSDLRIRRVTPQVDRVPAGTAPIVTVTIQGEAERVELQSETGTYEMIFNGDAWHIRLPIPGTATDLYPFTVVAYQGDGQTTKKSQIVIDASSPATEVTVASPVQPGNLITVDLLAYFEVKTIDIQSDLSLTFETSQTDDGHYVATALVPNNAEDKVYSLTISVTSKTGQTFSREETFRILIP